jgi:hypothetical protein
VPIIQQCHPEAVLEQKSDLISKITRVERSKRVAQGVEDLPSKSKVLSSNLSTTGEGGERKREK